MMNLNYIFPFFIIERLKTSVSFYIDKLGFEIRYIGPGENPCWAIVGRDNISIMLKEIAPDIKPIPNHARYEWAPRDAYISTADEECRSNGVVFNKSIHGNSDNMRGFKIKDADG